MAFFGSHFTSALSILACKLGFRNVLSDFKQTNKEQKPKFLLEFKFQNSLSAMFDNQSSCRTFQASAVHTCVHGTSNLPKVAGSALIGAISRSKGHLELLSLKTSPIKSLHLRTKDNVGRFAQTSTPASWQLDDLSPRLPFGLRTLLARARPQFYEDDLK